MKLCHCGEQFGHKGRHRGVVYPNDEPKVSKPQLALKAPGPSITGSRVIYDGVLATIEEHIARLTRARDALKSLQEIGA